MSPHCHPRPSLTIPSPGLTPMSSHLFHLSSNPTSRSPSAGAVPLTHVPLLCHYRSISLLPFLPPSVSHPHHSHLRWSLSPITPLYAVLLPPHTWSLFTIIPTIHSPFSVHISYHSLYPRTLSPTIPTFRSSSPSPSAIPLHHHPQHLRSISPNTRDPPPTSSVSFLYHSHNLWSISHIIPVPLYSFFRYLSTVASIPLLLCNTRHP